MKLQFRLTVKSGTKTLAEIKGREVDGDLTIQEVTEKVIETEQFLERLTGHRFHIDVEQITNSK